MPVSFNLISVEPRFGGQNLSFSWSSGEGRQTGSVEATAAELPLPFQDLSARPQPISLLSWHTSVSDFLGRDRQIGELTSWAEGAERISTKIVTGPGGSGKSRLAAEFGKELREKSWSAGFVNLAQPVNYRVSSEGGLFLIDYPEEAQRQVQRFLGWLARSEYPTKIRVLLLTRQPLMFWQESFRAAKCEDIVDYNEVKLHDITGTELYAIYNSTVEKASDRLGTIALPLSQEAFTAWVGAAPENRLPLFVVAAAAHAVLRPDDPIIQYSGREVVSALVDRELRRLEPISEAAGFARETLARLLALATIAGRLDRAALARCKTLDELGLAEIEDPAAGLRTSGVLSDEAVESLKPDIVGAAHTAQTLGAVGEPAAEWVWFGLQANRDFATGCIRLARLIHDERLISGQRSSVIEQCLLDGIKGKHDRLLLLAKFLQAPETPYSLAGIEEAVWVGLVEAAPNAVLKAVAANNLAFCLLNQRDYDRAIALLREAVAAHDLFPAAFGDKAQYERGLAFMNLGRAYTETGQFQNAIRELRAAVRCFRQYEHKDDPSAHSALSGALDLLGRALHNEGESGGLKLLVEAARLAKELAESHPAAYAGDYVWRLLNLGVVKLAMGNQRGALASFEDAIAAARDVVEAQPGRHEEKLGKSLVNKAIVQAKLQAFED
ncbi:MAG TPA: tetratricopeptide repeat protein, partial [Stellaceae bacterium]|nr:tetratricopeptide repeat protein [Stellaceae bacterium]